MTQTNRFLSNNIFAIITALIVGSTLTWKTRHFQLDDALIYLRYLRNLFEGNGLVYNIGDRFNGLTSPLYSYLLIVANVAIQNLQITTTIISGFFLCCAGVWGGQLVAKNRYEQAICALFIVSFNYFYLTFGMETSLFVFLSALVLLCYKKESYFALGVTLGLLFLTRSEGLFLGIVIVADFVIRNRTLPHVRYLIAPVLLIAANLLFNYFYYGAFLPATGNAKIGQGKSGFWGTGLIFLNVRHMYGWVFGNDARMLWFLIPTGLLGLFVSRRERTTWLILAYLASLGAFYVLLNIPNYHWYYAPFYFFGMLFSAVGTWEILNTTFMRSKVGPLNFAAFLIAFLCSVWFVQRNFQLANIERGPMEAYKNMGTWINKNTPKDSVLAAVEIGTVGWYSDRYLIDILGLTNRYNADYIANKDVNSWLGKYNPDYILIHTPLWPHENSAKCLLANQSYNEVPAFHFEGYALIKRSEASDTRSRIQACARPGA